MNRHYLTASILCDDLAEMLVFNRIIMGDEHELAEFSIMDSSVVKNEFNGVLGRLRRGWRAFREQPIFYAQVVVSDSERAKRFLKECIDILDRVE